MYKKSIAKLLIFIFVIMLMSIACGTSDNSGTLIATSDTGAVNSEPSTNSSLADNNSEEEPAIEEPTTPTFYSVGDVIEVQEHTIVLSSVEIQSGILIASFAIKNNGNSEMNVSSLLNFSARNDAGENLDQEIFDCSPGLDGTIVAGDVLNGKICWSGASYPLKIYYDSSFYSSGAIVWQVTEDKVSDGGFSPDAIETYSVGDVIEIQNQTIALSSVEIQNGVLIASFLIKNNDNSEMSVSSMLSFSARNDAGDSLDQEIFDCSPGLDGTIVAGDVLKGQICWSGASYPIKIYYDSSFLGSGGIIVWQVNADMVSDVSFTPDAFETFSVGDVIEIQDHQITLVEANVTNGRLTATFLIENTGSSEMNVSSMLSFMAKNADGTRLEQDIFGCGSSGLDGTVIAGDRLRGSICWTGATLPVLIYYDASLFSSGTIVWSVGE